MGDSVDESNAPTVRPSVGSNEQEENNSNSNKDSSESKKEGTPRRGRQLISRSNTANADFEMTQDREAEVEESLHFAKTPEAKERSQTGYESPEELVNELKRKSFVETLLDKYPQKYEGSPSLERDDSLTRSDIKTKRIHSMVQSKKFTDLLCRSKPDGRPAFYSDRPRTESCSEEGDDVDSIQGNTDEDGTILEALEKDEKIIEGSDSRKFSGELSSSDRSLTGSPSNRRQKVNPVYKKSKFYNEGLNQEETVVEESKSDKKAEENEAEIERATKDRDDKVFKRKARRFTTLLNTDRIEARVVPEEKSAGKTHPQLMVLKVKIQNKRNANLLYDVIKTKGKILLNQEPYQRSKLVYISFF